MVSGITSDTIYKHLLAKHYGDHVAAIDAHDEVMRYLRLYAKDISEVSERKATPDYCVSDICFDTISRMRQFRSLYPDVFMVVEIGEELPEPEYEARFVVFDILFCCFYGNDLKYSRLHLNTRIRVPEIGRGFYVFDEDINTWADRVTREYWEAESSRDCAARNYALDAGLCYDGDTLDVYTGYIANDGSGNFYKNTGADLSGFVDGVRIRKVYRVGEDS